MSVYFIKPIGMDSPIKIGTSASPDARKDALERWSPFPLEIIAEVEGGRNLERKLHYHFFMYHEGREWFTAHKHLMDIIEAINNGKFTEDMLFRTPPNSKWRLRRARSKWAGKQGALSRRAWKKQYDENCEAPAKVAGVYKEERWDDLRKIEEWLSPRPDARNGVVLPEGFWG